MTRPLCIYHGNCADGFGAAWVVRRYFKGEVDFFPGVFGVALLPDVTDRHVIMVDFSYSKPVLERLAAEARSFLVLDHHVTAQQDLVEFHMPDRLLPRSGSKPWLPQSGVHALFDMSRSGAGLAWDYFFPDDKRPKLIDHIEDGDLWRFALPDTRATQAAVFSYPYDFATWDTLMEQAEQPGGLREMILAGTAIERRMLKDIGEILGVATRRMVIGGISVPVVNLPYTMASEAANRLAEGEPFAAAYFDRADARVFSLRSRGDGGLDVSAIAKAYGGGGHRNAAGFQVPIGWEGDAGVDTCDDS